MKTSKLALLGVIFCFNFSYLLSQTEKPSLIKSFGIGLHLQQFTSNYLFDMESLPTSKFILVISPNNFFRLEPEFGFWTAKEKSEEVSMKNINIGLGVLGMIQYNKLNTYGGLRCEYALTKYGDDTSYKSNNFSISPTIGTEFYLSENFSFGGEIAFKYSSMKSSIDPLPTYFEESEISSFSTETGLFIRFYF